MELLNTEFINKIFQSLGFLTVLLIVYLIALLFFWYESMRANKNRNAIFDQWFVTTIAMILWGRFMFLLTNWKSFIYSYWFWLPYEKYGENIYFFRAMPWRVLQIWDGGFLFIPMYFAFLVINYLYVVIFKKWRWKEMMYTVLASANMMLGGTLFVYGYFIQSNEVVNYGLYLLAFFLLFWSLRGVLRMLYRRDKLKLEKMMDLFSAIYLVLSTILIGYIFLSQDISTVDKVHVYATLAFSAFMLMIFLLDVRRGEVAPPQPDLSMGKDRTITLNQSIKIKPR
ncbi:MAG: hypothetical protein QY318_01020 [Candidatus Dojkabacteria bacterium]|nr:MAG: hypothetical protein QY318_01020 [Candidatus Dojkabacteria bacterium]